MSKRTLTLRRYLRQTKTTQLALAKRLGISQPYLNQILNGRRTPSLELAVDIERETGVEMKTLLAVAS